jgi:plasmid stabilization system protein ParE
MRVVFQPRARDDLWGQLDWIAKQAPASAKHVEQLIGSGLRTLAEYPHLGRSLGGSNREWTIKMSRNSLIFRYRVRQDRIDIARVFHSARDRS